MLNAPINAGYNPCELTRPILVQNLNCIEGCLWCYANYARAIECRRYCASAVCAVTMVVHGRGRAWHKAHTTHIVRVKVRVIEVNASVYNGYCMPLPREHPQASGALTCWIPVETVSARTDG